MDAFYTSAAFWSAIAAVGSFVTAVVIALSSRHDRRQQRELAARTVLRPDQALATGSGCTVDITNQGPATAWKVRVRARLPEAARDSEIPAPAQPKTTIPALPVAGTFRVDIYWPEIPDGTVSQVGLDIHWVEDSGVPRSIPVDVTPAKQPGQ